MITVELFTADTIGTQVPECPDFKGVLISGVVLYREQKQLHGFECYPYFKGIRMH